MAAWKTFGQKRSLRLKDVNYALPYIYHVTFALNRKLDFHLNTRRVAEVIVSALLKSGRELQYEILAFCIMLDHVHVLCQPQADQISLSRFIGRVKGKASRELGLTGIGKPVWQRGFYDHILRSEENVWDVARYIADNPVRAGLVNQFEEYPYSYVKGLKNVALKGDATGYECSARLQPDEGRAMLEADSIERASRLIRGSRYRVALTGAGISTPSGIPDFRSPGGLWSQANPMEVASLEAFRRNPRAFYEWFRPRAESFFAAQPNAAHRALAELERLGALEALITQNIDDLHRRAGSRRIIELHGNAHSAHCLECGRQGEARRLWERYQRDGEIPSCVSCGGLLKPHVILFGELLPTEALRQAWQEAQRCDLMLVVGSSLEVTPAADLPFVARERGAQVIVVNLQPTPIDRYAEVVIREDAAEILPRLVEGYRAQ